MVAALKPGGVAEACGQLEEFDPVLTINGAKTAEDSDFGKMLGEGVLEIELEVLKEVE